jgi:hypothetical protein
MVQAALPFSTFPTDSGLQYQQLYYTVDKVEVAYQK